MTIYIDVLIFDNMLLNSVILMAVSSYMKRGKTIFLILSSAIGTIYSVLMVMLPVATILNSWFFKVLLSILMVLVAFFPKTLKEFFVLLICFYVVTFIFAGLAIALIFLWGQTPELHNGIVYFSWSSPVKYLLVVAVIGMLLTKNFIKNIQKRKFVQSQIAELDVYINNVSCRLTALIDTGNELKDPLTGDNVIVAEIFAVADILPALLAEQIRNSKEEIRDLSVYFSGNESTDRFRLVPFRSLGCEHGLLPGIKTDYIVFNGSINDNINEVKKDNIVLCLTFQKLSKDETYHALIGSDFNINY
ncbi:MAG: hypothetical protein E7388_05910 [Ruminococcaceae bacterium]|nr:hypothetical protein [Oscillospiraceae bacterium]